MVNSDDDDDDDDDGDDDEDKPPCPQVHGLCRTGVTI